MKIYLLEREQHKEEMLKKYFAEDENLIIVCDDFENFMDNNQVKCIVSPR